MQPQAGRRDPSESNEREWMHLRIDIDPQQPARTEREPAGGARQRSPIDVRDVGDGSHDGSARPVERRRTSQGAFEEEFGRDCFHQSRLQRQHPRVQIARGEHAVRQPHRTIRNEMTPPRQSIFDDDVAVHLQRVLAAVELRVARKRQRPRELHGRKELRQKRRLQIGETEIRIPIGNGVGDGCFDLSGGV